MFITELHYLLPILHVAGPLRNIALFMACLRLLNLNNYQLPCFLPPSCPRCLQTENFYTQQGILINYYFCWLFILLAIDTFSRQWVNDAHTVVEIHTAWCDSELPAWGLNLLLQHHEVKFTCPMSLRISLYKHKLSLLIM